MVLIQKVVLARYGRRSISLGNGRLETDDRRFISVVTLDTEQNARDQPNDAEPSSGSTVLSSNTGILRVLREGGSSCVASA